MKNLKNIEKMVKKSLKNNLNLKIFKFVNFYKFRISLFKNKLLLSYEQKRITKDNLANK